MRHLPLHSEQFQYIERSFRDWLDVIGYAQGSVYCLPNTIRELLSYLEKEKKITTLNRLDSRHIKDFYHHLKTRTNTMTGGALKGNTLNKHIQALQKFMDYLRQSGRLTLPKIYIPYETDETLEITPLTTSEIKQLYKATENYHLNTPREPLNARDRAMLTVFYSCGLRRNEGVHLNVSDIHWERHMLHVRKGKNYKERFVPFNDQNKTYLEAYVYDSRPQLLKSTRAEALFISQRGSRSGGQSLLLRLKLLIQRTGDPVLRSKSVGLHTLRHSIATHLLESGMSLENVSRFLGHTSLESTQIYTHLIEQEDDSI